MSFDCSIREASPTTIEMHMAGSLDEHAKLPYDFDFSKAKNLYIDFSLVNFVNSEGIKVWVTFSEKLGEIGGLTVHLRKCNREVINQVNRTVGFLGPNARILSLYVPVYCPKCETHTEVFQELPIDKLDEEQILNKVESCKCGPASKSRKFWEVDINEDEYLSFLKRN